MYNYILCRQALAYKCRYKGIENIAVHNTLRKTFAFSKLFTGMKWIEVARTLLKSLIDFGRYGEGAFYPPIS